MKHFLLLFCLCSAMGLAQNQSAPPSANPNPSSTTQPARSNDEGPFLRHLKARNSNDWNGAKKVAGKVAEDGAKVASAVVVIPAIPVYFVALLIHCNFHDCAS